MPRVKGGVTTRRRKKKVFSQTKGFWGKRNSSFRSAKETLLRADAFAYRDRKAKKREFRSMWIARINAATRLGGLSYSRFMNGLKKANIDLDRKVLSDLAANDAVNFAKLVETAKQNLA